MSAPAPQPPQSPVLPASAKPEKTTSMRPYVFRGEGTHWLQNTAWIMGRTFFQLVAVLLFHARISGRHNIPRTGAALLVTNHQSLLDPWIIGIALKRQLHYMARETLFIGGFTQTLIEMANAFPVKRGRADSTAVRTAIERLHKGFIVNIFPESTRTPDGTIGPIAAGVALIVHRAKVPIIPSVIDGAYEAWPRGQKMPHPHPVRILYGKSIPYEALADKNADEIAVAIRRALVALQEEIGSVHAAASRNRMAADLAQGKKRLSGAAAGE